MYRTIVKRTSCLLVAAALLASCASHVKIEDSWKNQSLPETTYRKLLVIAVTKKSTLRELLENIFAETLRRHGVEAVPSYTLLGDLNAADKSRVQALASEVGADAVVITHGLSRAEHTNYSYFGGSVQERVALMETTDENSSTVIAMSAIGVAPLERDFVKGTLMTRFFDAGSAEMAWSALTEVVNDGRKADACWDFSILLTKALAEDQLIVINAKEFRRPTL